MAHVANVGKEHGMWSCTACLIRVFQIFFLDAEWNHALMPCCFNPKGRKMIFTGVACGGPSEIRAVSRLSGAVVPSPLPGEIKTSTCVSISQLDVLFIVPWPFTTWFQYWRSYFEAKMWKMRKTLCSKLYIDRDPSVCPAQAVVKTLGGANWCKSFICGGGPRMI